MRTLRQLPLFPNFCTYFDLSRTDSVPDQTRRKLYLVGDQSFNDEVINLVFCYFSFGRGFAMPLSVLRKEECGMNEYSFP